MDCDLFLDIYIVIKWRVGTTVAYEVHVCYGNVFNECPIYSERVECEWHLYTTDYELHSLIIIQSISLIYFGKELTFYFLCISYVGDVFYVFNSLIMLARLCLVNEY